MNCISLSLFCIFVVFFIVFCCFIDNGNNISTKAELLQTINEGVNILDYIKDEKDIDFVTNAIIIEGTDDDSYYEETAEILFKSILYYVLFTENETKTLNRCKEIAKYGINEINKIRDMVSKEERANLLFKPVELASATTQKTVFEKLDERLSKI